MKLIKYIQSQVLIRMDIFLKIYGILIILYIDQQKYQKGISLTNILVKAVYTYFFLKVYINGFY